jgi:hypothetical protein
MKYAFRITIGFLAFLIGMVTFLIWSGLHIRYYQPSPKAESSQIPPINIERAVTFHFFAEVFHDFEFLGDSKIEYTPEAPRGRSYPLAEVSPMLWQGQPKPPPATLEKGKRYFFRNTSLKIDLFYKLLEKRFREQGMEINVFISASSLAVVYNLPIPARFIGSLRLSNNLRL